MIGKDVMNFIFGRYVNGYGVYIFGIVLFVKIKIILFGFIEMYGM